MRDDRAGVLVHLRETGLLLVGELNNWNDVQWTWRPAEGRWSAQENLEHLIFVERGVLRLVRLAMGAPAAPPERTLTDDQVWRRALGENGHRVEAPERVRPTGSWLDRGAARDEWARLRRETVSYLEGTDDPLRERWIRVPIGDLDGLQALLLLAGHATRHRMQMQAIRTAEGFPG